MSNSTPLADERLAAFDEAATYIRSHIATIPTTAIILGSGLGRLADHIDHPTVIPYAHIPHFKQSTATGHKGNLVIGSLGAQPVMAMQGRFHYYEGYAMADVTFPIRVFARLGVTTLIVSNAAGGLNPDFRVGDLMLITDHINFMPNPLVGKNLDDLGPRFPDMTTVYSRRLRQAAQRQASRLGITLREGVYVAETGPTYETPAEYRMYRQLGGDAVGMSTVPEVIVARHCGMEIFGISVITNCAKDLSDTVVNNGDDVVAVANAAGDTLTQLIVNLVSQEM